MKVLLTSVSSLVGHNILDVLEYPGRSRRSLLQVVGTNSIAAAACNFRCDRCYLVPPTVTPEYPMRMRDILLEERPDLILCGRDEDTYALSRLKREHPGLPGILPVGTTKAALIGLDKWQTWQFARRHDLPFAESFMPGESGNGAALRTFCERVGYPLIAKPARGAASRGVCFIRNAGDTETMARQPGYLFQEYVGDRKPLDAYIKSLQGPSPLFAQFAHAGYVVCHTVIAPDGAIAPITATDNRTDSGHTTASTRIVDPKLDALTENFARALLLEGGAGPMSVQLRKDRHGAWKAIEINLRTSGGTLARFLRGTDELFLIINAFMPGAIFPELRPPGAEECTHVIKQYYSYPVPDSQVAALQQAGVWSRP